MLKTNFETYLEKQLENPAVRTEFERYGASIRNVERLLSLFDERRSELGITKTQIAEYLHLQPSNVRRLFTAPNQNPSFAYMVELANCLELEIRIVPKPHSKKVRSGEDSQKRKHLQVS